MPKLRGRCARRGLPVPSLLKKYMRLILPAGCRQRMETIKEYWAIITTVFLGFAYILRLNHRVTNLEKAEKKVSEENCTNHKAACLKHVESELGHGVKAFAEIKEMILELCKENKETRDLMIKHLIK